MHGHVYGTYTVGYGPRTRPCFATYRLRTRPCTDHVHGPSVTAYTAVFTAVFTARVHGGVRTVYIAVYTAVHAVPGRCTRCTPACNGRVHSASTAVYKVHLHGRVLCTRPCLRPVYTAAHGCVQTVYTAVHGPRTWSVSDPITAVYAARTRPCTVNTTECGRARSVHARVHRVVQR